MSPEMITIILSGIVNVGVLIGLATKLESRLTRLETESKNHAKNIDELWDHYNRRVNP